jgi:hypothetical protein
LRDYEAFGVCYFFLLAAAFFAERDREAAERFFAALRACRESAVFDAALRPSRFSAFNVARERFDDFLLLRPALRVSRAACSRVSFEAFFGGGSFTPARRASDNPIAIACFVERAPCFPSRMCSISCLTNSPACVLGDFPSRLSFRARSNVSFSGIVMFLSLHEIKTSPRVRVPLEHTRLTARNLSMPIGKVCTRRAAAAMFAGSCHRPKHSRDLVVEIIALT